MEQKIKIKKVKLIEKLYNNLSKAGFDSLLVPSISFVNSSVLALFYYKETNGIVISAGHDIGSVSAVLNGKVLGSPSTFDPKDLLSINLSQHIGPILASESCNSKNKKKSYCVF